MIDKIIGREILDSRGNPTVEVDVFLDNGIKASASVPSGASVGSKEALELRDKDKNRYYGLGVLKAVNNVNKIIAPALIGKDVSFLEEIDRTMIDLDGTLNKSKLGANATLGVSLACYKAKALKENKPLYELFEGCGTLPVPMMNILNGGAHADNNIDFQEFMIVPQRDTIKERIRVGSEIFHSLKNILKEKGYSTGVGDEGGFAPSLNGNYEALDLICEAIIKAGYNFDDAKIALDVAASELYSDGIYKIDGKYYDIDDLIGYYVDLVNKYPIISIEDPVYEEDYEGFRKITEILGNKVQLVGDDLFVTNKKYLLKGYDLGAGNAILIKPNQIGTVSETIETINTAKKCGYNTIISHRSGETEDTSIAFLAVDLGIPYIKTGSMSRTDRICKYNELIRIEEKLNK